MEQTTFDFYFTIRPVSILKNAFDALSDPSFNPSHEAVIQVSEAGCEFTVFKFDEKTWKESFGYLRLKATGLEGFRCRAPLKKLFEWAGIPALFKSSVDYEASSVTVFVVEGSNKLSFQWGNTINDFGYGVPVDIDLENILTPFDSFPNVAYGFEAVLPSQVIRAMSIKLQKQPKPWPPRVTVTLQPASIEVSMPGFASGSLDGQEQELEHVLKVDWQHWKALESATLTGNKCSVYLVTAPNTGIMLRFHIQNLGDIVFLEQADFDDDPDRFPLLGQFGRFI